MKQTDLEFLRDGLLLKCDLLLRELIDNDTLRKKSEEEKQKTKKEKSE